MNETGPQQAPLTTSTSRGRGTVSPWATFAIIAITLLGAFLRLYHVGHESLWLDELLSWSLSHNVSGWYDWIVRTRGETNPPGYQLLFMFVVRYLGDSETMLRLPSAIAGIAAVPALYALGRRMYSSWVGLAAALLLAVSRAPIYFSQEARVYALALLMTLFSFLLWYPLFASETDRVTAPRRWTVGYVAVAIVLLYLHYYGILIVLGQALVALWLHGRRREGRRRVQITYLVVLLAYLPWLLIGIYQYFNSHKVDWISEPQPRIFFDFLRFAFNGSDVFAWVGLGAVAVLLVHLLWRRRGAQPRFVREDAIILGWLLYPIVTAYLVSIIGRPLLVARYLIVVLPAVYLIVARVLAQLPGPRLLRNVAIVALAVAILVDLTGRLGYYTRPYKTQYREAIAYVVQNDTTVAPPLVITFPWKADVFDYYFERQGSRLRTDVGGSESDIPKVDEVVRTRQPERMWFIRADREVHPAFLEYLQRDWRLVAKQEFFKTDVWLFERK